MRGYIYPLLIAKFLSPVAVTIFALPVKLMQFPTDGVGTMTEIVNPLSSKLEAQNNFPKLRQLILHSSQTAFLLLIPLASFLIIFGKELLTAWVGSRYTSAYPILVLLTIGLGSAATQCCIQSMLFGIERHKALIWFRLAEGLSVAIVGSIALKLWGLYGFAAVIMGTLLTTSIVLVPRHLCKVLSLSFRTYLLEGPVKSCLVGLPTVAVFLLVHHMLTVNTWRDLLLAGVLGGCSYGLTLSVAAFASSHAEGKWYAIGVLQAIAQRIFPIVGSREPAIESIRSSDS